MPYSHFKNLVLYCWIYLKGKHDQNWRKLGDLILKCIDAAAAYARERLNISSSTGQMDVLFCRLIHIFEISTPNDNKWNLIRFKRKIPSPIYN